MNSRSSESQSDPVILFYYIPDPRSSVGEWKVVEIGFSSYEMAFLTTLTLDPKSWGRIENFHGIVLRRFGVEER
ncbi:MAG: hypothetical protein WAX44_00915 [Minisyncoccia bacterium]